MVHDRTIQNLSNLDELPGELKDTDIEASKLLEGTLGEIEISKVAVFAGAHVDDCEDHLGVRTLLRHQNLLAADLLAVTHLSYFFNDACR